jgi:hypothetical protein
MAVQVACGQPRNVRITGIDRWRGPRERIVLIAASREVIAANAILEQGIGAGYCPHRPAPNAI